VKANPFDIVASIAIGLTMFIMLSKPLSIEQQSAIAWWGATAGLATPFVLYAFLIGYGIILWFCRWQGLAISIVIAILLMNARIILDPFGMGFNMISLCVSVFMAWIDAKFSKKAMKEFIG
jgi:hypothetical protein